MALRSTYLRRPDTHEPLFQHPRVITMGGVRHG